MNCEPKPVVTVADSGHPLTASDIDSALRAYGAVEQPGDRERLGQTVAPPNSQSVIVVASTGPAAGA